MGQVKKLKYFFIVFFAFVFLAGGFFFWYFRVGVDESRVQALLKNYSKQIETLPLREENRIFGYVDVFEDFKKIRSEWSQSTQKNWEELEYKYLEPDFDNFLKEKFTEFERREVLTTLQPLNEKFLKVLKRKEAVIPLHTLASSREELKQSINSLELFDLSRLLLTESALLLQENRSKEIWPLLKGNILLAQDLCSSPIVLLNEMTCIEILKREIDFIFVFLDRIPKNEFRFADQLLITVQDAFSHVRPLEESVIGDLYSGSKAIEMLRNDSSISILKRLFSQDEKLYWQYQLRRIDILKSLNLTPEQKLEELRYLGDKKNFKKWAFLTTMVDLGSSWEDPYTIFLTGKSLENSLPLLRGVFHYFEKYSRFPRDLNVLMTEDYVKEIPSDSFNSGKIRYLPKKNGFLLYSAGWNGTDEKAEGDDIVIIRR